MLLREMTDPAFGRTFQRFARCAVAGLALVGLAACGGGGSSIPAATAPTTPTPTPATPTPTPPEIPITPAPTDHPDTLAAAAVIAAGATVEGAIDSPDDVDFFKVELSGPGTVTFWTTGEADTEIALLDGEGADLSPTVSEGRVSKATTLDEVFAQVSGQEGSTGGYALHNEFVEQPGQVSLQSPGENEGNCARVRVEQRVIDIREASSHNCQIAQGFHDHRLVAPNYSGATLYSVMGENSCSVDLEFVMQLNVTRIESPVRQSNRGRPATRGWNFSERFSIGLGRDGIGYMPAGTTSRSWPVFCAEPSVASEIFNAEQPDAKPTKARFCVAISGYPSQCVTQSQGSDWKEFEIP